MFSHTSSGLRQYLLITGNYWAFTLTDGALRMLVLLQFHQLGYSPLQLALLFLLYEFCGVVTNLLGGWLGARIGLNRTMNLGLSLQLVALGMLLVPTEWLQLVWVMAAQALSGIAKDLNKMSAKSAVKLLVNEGGQQRLFRWVAMLTGSKNALKGAGFFLGALLLQALEFRGALLCMIVLLTVTLSVSLWRLQPALGRAKRKPKFNEIWSKSRAVNQLAAARLCLFAARDIWFVVALPVFLSSQYGWDFWQIGGYLAVWVIGYGAVQSATPWLLPKRQSGSPHALLVWGSLLTLIPIATAMGLDMTQTWPLLIGLACFGVIFAINSSVHSFLIVHYARQEGVSMDVGFYYMANAAGRLLGTLISGLGYQLYGMPGCLWFSGLALLLAVILSVGLPTQSSSE